VAKGRGPEAADSSVEEIKREARVVGLRGVSTPSLESIERRRLQLWAVTVFILLAVSVGVALVSTWRPGGESVVTPTALRVGVVLLAVGFGIDAIEKEFHLRRLARLLTDQRVLTTARTNRLHEMSLLLDAGKAMNSVLELPAVLETILRSAVNANSDRIYTVYDLQAASLFAEQAAGAIANARLYETERMHAFQAELGKEFGALQIDSGIDA
jgi:hypothetical protein